MRLQFVSRFGLLEDGSVDGYDCFVVAHCLWHFTVGYVFADNQV